MKRRFGPDSERGPVRARVSRALGATLLLGTVLTGATAAAVAGAAPAGASPPLYYVAMGDSLGAGVGASPASAAYVNLVYQHERARIPGLHLENLSCSGATTTSVLAGPNCSGTTTQIALATAFLAAHRGHVAFLTIDIGANDVDGCTNGVTVNTTCLTNGLAAINTNLPQILTALTGAYPGLDVVGMNYYDPFLVSWLSGASGQTLAEQSVTEADTLNTMLDGLYANAGFPTADVATAFATDDFALTGTYDGQTEPQNVANICNWTHMCAALDFHADNAGHAVIAQTFEPLIDALGGPTAAPGAVAAAAGNGSAKVSWSAPADGPALSGYAVTAFVAGVAQASRSFTTPATTQTMTGLTNGLPYTFAVAAVDPLGTGPESDPSAAVIVGTPAAVLRVTVTSGSTTTATGTLKVTHTGAANHGAPITQYSTTCTSNDGGPTESALSAGSSAAPIIVAGVTTGNTYSCTVVGSNSRGAGPVSGASNPVIVGAPAAPMPPTATNTGAGTLAVAFRLPADNGSALTGVRATCTSTTGGVTGNASASAGPITVGGLTPGATYTCTAAATNGRGPGLSSKASKAVTA